MAASDRRSTWSCSRTPAGVVFVGHGRCTNVGDPYKTLQLDTEEACQQECNGDATCIAASISDAPTKASSNSSADARVLCQIFKGSEAAISKIGRPVFQHLGELVLDGSTCALRSEVDQSALPTGMDPYTLEAEIKTTSSANQGIISWGSFPHSKQVNALRTQGSGSLKNYWWGADLTASTGGVSLADGRWHHVMATFDGTTRKLYVDNTEIGSDTPTGLAVTRTDNFCVGYAFCPLWPGLTGPCAGHRTTGSTSRAR